MGASTSIPLLMPSRPARPWTGTTWSGCTTKTRDADLIRQLKIVSAIGATRRTQAPSGPTLWWDRAVETGVAVVLAIAVAQLVLAIVGAFP